MDIHSFQSRLKTLNESMNQTLHAIHNFPRVQPDRVALRGLDFEDTEAHSSTIEWNTSDIGEEIHENLIALEEDLKLLQQDSEDVPAATARQTSLPKDEELYGLKPIIVSLSDRLKIMQISFRKAKLKSKRDFEDTSRQLQLEYLTSFKSTTDETANASKNPTGLIRANMSHSEMRNSLFMNRHHTNHRDIPQTNEDLILTRSSDLTASLRRTHELLTSEVSRSRFAQETLNASNLALESLNQRYGTLDDLLSKSRGLLGSLLRSQKSDTWYLETAVWILISTIGWLIFRRMLYGPLWWIVYLPCKTVWFATTRILHGNHNSVGIGQELPPQTVMTLMSSRIIESSHDAMVIHVARPSDTTTGYPKMGLDTISNPLTEVPSSHHEVGNDGQTHQHTAEASYWIGSLYSHDRSPQPINSIVRGDGHILPPRAEEKAPINPRKRMVGDDPREQAPLDQVNEL